MVKFPKSNWFIQRIGWMKFSFLLLPIIIFAGSFNNPKSLTRSTPEKVESVAKLENPQTAVEKSAGQVQEIAVIPEQIASQPPSKVQTISHQFASKGLALKIDEINLNIPLSTTTLGKNSELLVPANPNVAAWYRTGPKLGEKGTALVTGHLDSAAGPGVFYNLRKLKAGDLIQAQRPDGKVATYKVDKLASYAQDSTFPWNAVYRTSGSSALRIITCDGVFNPKTQRYSRNLVVYASLVSLN